MEVTDLDKPMFDMSDASLAKLVRWREQQLTNVGFALLSARLIAVRRDIDLHQVVDMVKAGCPPHVAMEVVL